MQPGFQDGRTRAVEQQGNKMLWAGAKHLGFQAYIGIGLNRVRPSGPARGGIVHFSLPILPSMDNCRSEEHTSELQSLMRISYAVFCLKKKKNKDKKQHM